MKKNNKRIIWGNIELDLDKWEFDPDWLKEYQPTEDEKWARLAEENNMYLDDARINLDIPCNEIVAIANIGLWNGRRQGYKLYMGNVNNILYGFGDYAEWYCDDKDVRATFHHHDGSNFVLYREIKPDVDEGEFLKMILNGDELTDEILDKYTNSLRPYIANVYGW